MGVTSLILGIFGLIFGVFGWTGVGGVIGFALNLPAIILGAIGKKKGKKCSVGGLVCGIIGMVLSVILFIVAVAALGAFASYNYGYYYY